MEFREIVALSAAVVAAIIAFSKLVADKETRVSDFRKEWISSFRSALGELLGHAYVIAGRVRIRQVHGVPAREDDQAGAPLDPAGIAPAAARAIDFSLLEQELTSHWHELRKAHRAVLLHLNFAETAKPLSSGRMGLDENPELSAVWLALVESSKAKNMAHCKELKKGDASKRSSPASTLLVGELETLVQLLLGPYEQISTQEHYEQIKQSIDKATLLGNLVIKPEWNRIKSGERRYWVSLWAGGSVAFLGLVALISLVYMRPSVSPPSLPTQQWVEFKR